MAAEHDRPSGSVEAPQLVLLTGHPAPVIALAFSPDGRLLATSGQDSTTILWDVESGAVQQVWEREFSSDALAFTPDGDLLVASESGLSFGKNISFWSLETGQWQGTLPNVGGPMVFAPDGRLIGTDGESFLIVDGQSAHLLRRIPFGTRLFPYPLAVTISADGSTGAIGDDTEAPGELRVWDLASGELKRVRRLPGTHWWKEKDPHTGKLRITHGSPIELHVLALSPNGRVLALGGGGVLWLCDTRTGRRTHLLSCDFRQPESLRFSPDGKLLAAGTAQGTIHVWALPSGKPMLCLNGHSGGIMAIAFSPDGTLMASGGDDKSVKLWRTDTGECERQFTTLSLEASGVAHSPDGSRIAVSYTDGSVRLWNARTGALERVLFGSTEVKSLLFSADGRVLMTGLQATDGAWDTETGQIIRVPAAPETAGSDEAQHVCEALSPDGRTLAVSTGLEGTSELRRRDTGELLHTLPSTEEFDMVLSLVFSPDGTILASGHYGFRVRLWDVASGRLLRVLRMHRDSISSSAFSPDGDYLAVGGHYGGAVIVCNLRAERNPVRVVLTSNERKTSEGMAHILGTPPDELPGEEVTLNAHANGIGGVSFSPDGRTIATVGGDAALKLWEAATGRLLVTLLPLPPVDEGPTRDWIAYTDEGYYTASSGAEGFIRWRVGADLLEAAAGVDRFRRPEMVTQKLTLNG